MTIPTQREIEIPLLHLIYYAGGEVRPKNIYEPLADYFKLTKQEREQLLPNTHYKKFENNVQWARNITRRFPIYSGNCPLYKIETVPSP